MRHVFSRKYDASAHSILIKDVISHQVERSMCAHSPVMETYLYKHKKPSTVNIDNLSCSTIKN